MLADKKTLSTEKGITLIEIIVSVSLIALIIIAILPAITHSFIVIKKTKDNLVEHFFAQRYVEIIASTTEQCLLADGTTIPIINGQFPLRISGGTARNIVGGYVKRNDVLNFLAGIPHISINPYRLNEGYLPENYAAGPPYALRRSINITGYNTHFRTGLTSFRLVDFNSNNISGCTLSINSRTSARLDIPLNLLSSNSPYVIELQTGTEKVNAILLILLPDRMAIGKDPLTNLNRIIISSENPSYWIMRTPPSPGTVLLKDILFYNDSDDPLQNSKYLAAGSSGKIFFLKHGLPWQQAVTNCTQNLNHICWSQVQKMFVAVGDQGTILTASYSADYWIPRSSGVNTDLKNVVWDDINNQFIAIGQRGTIISSTDGIHWVNQVDEFTDQDDIRSRLQPVLWLDAAQGLQTGNDIHSGGGNITDGQKVQRWLDLSNYHNNATVKREPFKEYDAMGNLTNTTYYGPELEPGFNPGIKFDEYDDHLMITNTLAPGNSGRSIFIVTKNNNDTSEQKRFILLLNYNDPSILTGSSFRITPEMQVRLQGYMNFRPTALPPNQEMISDSLKLLSFKNKENAKIKDIRGYINGSIINPKPDPATAEQPINIQDTGTGIGASGNPSKTGQFFKGTISEILVCNREVDFKTRKQIEKYLLHKYSISPADLLDSLQGIAFYQDAGNNNYLRIVGNGTIRIAGIADQYENEIISMKCSDNWWNSWNQASDPGPLKSDEENIRINNIAFCGNKFFAPADKGLLFYQNPTATEQWNWYSLGANYTLKNIIYNGATSVYTLVGNDLSNGKGLVWISSDGASWSAKNLHDGTNMPVLEGIAGQ